MKKQGVLLVNLGSPDSTSVPDVRKYLRQFLMDKHVLDSPWPVRWFVVNCLILPKRPAESAEAYSAIWTDEGSPLIVTSRGQQRLLAEKTGWTVELAMRYQNPSIPDAVRKLADQGIEELVVVPLYPHFAMSSYESSQVEVERTVARIAPGMACRFVPPFYDRGDYLDALAASAKPQLEGGYDHVLFSFHGLPERHLRVSDPSGAHDGFDYTRCDGECPTLETCYKGQCHRTVDEFVERVGIPAEKHSTSFQSRLGREPWLRPYTDEVVKELPSRGVKKLLVLCPAFVTDCLETLEEIGIRAQEDFVAAGGEELTLVPCLNEHPAWIAALENMVREEWDRS